MAEFLTRLETAAPPPRRGRPAVAREVVRRLGVRAAEGMNPRARSPAMPPTLTGSAVYVLVAQPSEEDDVAGRPLSDVSGRRLLGLLGRDSSTDCCCRTLPPDGRPARPEEVEAFRTVVEASIASERPRVVVAVGQVPTQWALGDGMDGDKVDVRAAMGRAFPTRIGGHACWVCPVLDPEFVRRAVDVGRADDVPGKEWESAWHRQLDGAVARASSDERPRVVDPSGASGTVRVVRSLSDLERAVSLLMREERVGIDIETRGRRPYERGAAVLCASFSDGETTYAVPLSHRESPGGDWSGEVVRRLLPLLLSRKVLKVAHNLPFELEWFAHLLAPDREVLRAAWSCSLQAAFVLHSGPPGHGGAGLGLDFLCRWRFGLPLKALTLGGRNRDRLDLLPLDELLRYNAPDARWCALLHDDLEVLVREQGLEESFRRQVERVPALVAAQAAGVLIDQGERARLDAALRAEVASIDARIEADPDVVAWRSRRRAAVFRASSNQDVLGLLRDLGHAADSADAKVLEPLRTRHPVLGLVLDRRGAGKLLGTYVERFDPAHEGSYVYPDGLVHCQFEVARARTARLSCEGPNNQNWPKRKRREVRRQIVAPSGHLLVAVDQGQVEARVLAMESRDPEWVRMLREDYDVHSDWAERIAGIDAKFAALLKSEPKVARHRAKNGWVFPAFYGSAPSSIARNLKLDERRTERLFEEFWDVFRGVKEWQHRKWEDYQREHLVRSLTGRVRRAPLSWNMAINTPIQCAASDICVDAMVRLHRLSLVLGEPWLAAVLQIHDDLTFVVPEAELDSAVATIVREQLGFQAPWVNVPLSVEVEVGPNLFDMESAGKWTSEEIA